MKSVDIKRIAALGAGALLVGASLAAAAPVTYGTTEVINAQGKPVVKVVVGATARASDGVAAANIAAVIGNLAYKSSIVTAKLIGEPTCSVAGAGAAGACAVTDKKVTLEIPGSATIPGAYYMKTYIYGYLDNDVRTEDDQSKTSDTSLEITGDYFADFAEKSLTAPGISGTFKETVKAYVKTDRLASFDKDAKKYAVTPAEVSLLMSFDHDTYGGVPPCTKESVIEAATYSVANCTPEDTYLTERQRLKVKFLGEDWVISEMTPTTSIKLAKESTPATIVYIGGNVTAGVYTIKLADLTIPYGEVAAQAIIEIYDTNNVKIKDDKVTEGESKEITLPDGNKVTIKVYKTAPGLGLSRWAEMAVLAQEIELKDGSKVDDTDNKNWTVSLGWKKYKSTSDTNVLKNISLSRTDIPEVKEGDSINIIGKPALYNFMMVGQTLTDADFQSLEFKVAKDKVRTFYATEDSTSTFDLKESKDLITALSDKKAFRTTEIGGGDDRYRVSWGAEAGVPAFYEKPDKGLVLINSVPTTTSVTLNNATNNAQYWNGTAWVVVPDAYNGTVLNLTGLLGSVTGVVDYKFQLMNRTSTDDKLYNLTQGVGPYGAGALVIQSPANNYSIVNKSYFDGISIPVPYSNITSVEGVALTYYMPDTGETAALGYTSASGFSIVEDAQKTAASDLNITYTFTANITAGEFKSPAASTEKIQVAYYSGTGSATSGEFAAGYVSQKGSKLETRASDRIVLKMAEKVGSLQYAFKTAAAVVEAGVTTITLAVNGTTTVGTTQVKVKDIPVSVGACTATATGANCTASKTGMSAVLDPDGVASKTVNEVYKFAATDRLAVLDSAAPTAESLILVGGPIVNTVTSATLKGTDVKIDKPGVKVVKEIGNKIVVAGYTAEDTIAAADQFISELIAGAA